MRFLLRQFPLHPPSRSRDEPRIVMELDRKPDDTAWATAGFAALIAFFVVLKAPTMFVLLYLVGGWCCILMLWTAVRWLFGDAVFEVDLVERTYRYHIRCVVPIVDRQGGLEELERVVVEKVADTVGWLAHRRYWIEGKDVLIYVGSTSGKATRWQAPFLAERLGLPYVVR